MCRVNFTPNGQSKIEINGYRSSSELEVSYFNICSIFRKKYMTYGINITKLIIILGAVQKPWFWPCRNQHFTLPKWKIQILSITNFNPFQHEQRQKNNRWMETIDQSLSIRIGKTCKRIHPIEQKWQRGSQNCFNRSFW